MADRVDTKEAAALWGCTPRTIQLYVQMGRLVPTGCVQRIVERPDGSRTTARTPMFNPADILALRARARRRKSDHGTMMARRNNANPKLVAHRQRLLRAYYTIPKAERTGGSWMTLAYNQLHKGA